MGYRIDLYFHKYKLAIEVDELGHNDRNIDYEIQRQQALDREFNYIFIRINPDAIDFNIFREIKKIYRRINKLIKEQTKNTHYIKCISIVKSVIGIQVIHIQRK